MQLIYRLRQTLDAVHSLDEGKVGTLGNETETRQVPCLGPVRMDKHATADQDMKPAFC